MPMRGTPRARIVHPEWDRLETDPWADAKAAVDTAIADHLDLFDGYDWRGVSARLERPASSSPVTRHSAPMVTEPWRARR